MRSLNVALRQLLDLYVCLRPVRYFKGVPSIRMQVRRLTRLTNGFSKKVDKSEGRDGSWTPGSRRLPSRSRSW
jgi:isocitrate/isopropylmalate dehydrogenase